MLVDLGYGGRQIKGCIEDAELIPRVVSSATLTTALAGKRLMILVGYPVYPSREADSRQIRWKSQLEIGSLLNGEQIRLHKIKLPAQ
jgi:hypothetical protein